MLADTSRKACRQGRDSGFLRNRDLLWNRSNIRRRRRVEFDLFEGFIQFFDALFDVFNCLSQRASKLAK